MATTDAYGLYNAKMWSDTAGCKIRRSGVSGIYTYNVASDRANRPVNFVSWGDSARFANWLHNGKPRGAQGLSTTEDGAYYLNGATSQSSLMAVSRESDWKWAIASEDEWYKAAYYNSATTSYYDYPTRSNTAPGQDMDDVSGNNANCCTYPYAWPIDSGKYTTVAGQFQNSGSPYGTFDQGGNVWEWNETVIYAGDFRGLRGGGFDDFPWRASDRNSYDPTYEGNSFGFRVSSVPEPGSITLCLAGGLCLLGFAWRRRTA